MNSKIKAIGAAAIAIVGLSIGATLFERVDAGEYKVVQTVGGKLEVLDSPGWVYTGLVSKMDDYKEAGVYYFSSNKRDGGSGSESAPISVIFSDGARGTINGNYQFKLPADAATRVRLHRLYGRRYEAIVQNLIRKSVREAVLSSATYFKGEEAYSYGRSEFVKLINEQLEEGILETVRKKVVVKDAEGHKFVESKVSVAEDKNGNHIVSKKSKLKEFNVMNIGLTIEGVELDKKTMQYIEKKKNAEFMKIQKQAEAEQSKQDAITAAEKGKAEVARAKAQANVAKQKAVTQAEQKKEVAELKAQQELNVAELGRKKAEAEAKAMLVKKEAEAKANKLLVKAGLTPKEKAMIDMQTKIGVAAELSKVNVPHIVVTGSGSKGGTSPMDAIGIKMLMDIDKKMSGGR